jgi:hypothetical protein
MSTLSTPILRDNTLASVAVTELFRAGDLFVRDGTYRTVTADRAVFDNLTVTNLTVNGTVTGNSSNVDLGLSPNQLVATNSGGQPISFPYGTSNGDIVRRDSDGSASFTSWTTPATTTQFFFATGNGTGTRVLFQSVVDATTLTVPDVGANANMVVYGDNNAKNVVSSGDNILNLVSTNNAASILVGGPNVAGSIMASEFDINGSKASSIEVEQATKRLTIRGPSDNIKFSITPNGATSTIGMGGPFTPTVNAQSDLSNGNHNGFKSLAMTIGTASITNFTNTITLDNSGPCILTLNTSNTDTIVSMGSKSLTWNNSFITTTTKFIANVQGLNGTINGALVGVPYVVVTAQSAGTCTVTTYNISTTLTAGHQVIVAIMVLP